MFFHGMYWLSSKRNNERVTVGLPQRIGNRDSGNVSIQVDSSLVLDWGLNILFCLFSVTFVRLLMTYKYDSLQLIRAS